MLVYFYYVKVPLFKVNFLFYFTKLMKKWTETDSV